MYGDCSAFDIGCGRGEWLELMAENNVHAQGVDLDDDMVSACQEQGFDVKKKDALTALQALPDESTCVLTGFHIAEHIPFDILKKVVREAKRILKPAGILILETPNPENPLVGSCNFYTDPSHIHPIPPTLLSFLPEYEGFYRESILRLQEDPKLHNMQEVSLVHALTGASPDYSVVAQKNAAQEQLSLFDDLFSRKYGLTLYDLCAAYDKNVRDMLKSSVKNFVGRANAPYTPGTNMLQPSTSGILLEKFYPLEDFGRWTCDNCKIHLFAPDFEQMFFNTYLSFSCHTFNSERIVQIRINGWEIFSFKAESKNHEIRIKIPNEVIKHDNVIEFISNEPSISPKDAGISDDARPLFLAFDYIKIDEDISAIQQALAELHGLILNTRHRTLYGACAWLWHKVFK